MSKREKLFFIFRIIRLFMITLKKDKNTNFNAAYILLDSKLVIISINKKALSSFNLEKKK